ncbi:hypothetical protein OXPF_28420 [Oxobacter pfennigii]|uniref:Uncharacterized protein n=1 Tax=Oxobacter pfennigii TaxID=36849 RepID=A0A0P8W6M0_9CLOT|nr:DUF6514 family protein [Oxobacter pfennigii]KPU43401.1 hypothetical protein OXPF_28420 [Oxobacter pfennigii]
MDSRHIELYSSSQTIEGFLRKRQAIYRYILIETHKEIEFGSKKIDLPCFGIEIVREELTGDGAGCIEKDSIEFLTTYRYKAVQLLKKLYDNTVSPLHLIDIAGIYADEWIKDFDEQLSAMAVQ